MANSKTTIWKQLVTALVLLDSFFFFLVAIILGRGLSTTLKRYEEFVDKLYWEK
ncbi:hypothetical protein HYZ64_02900 [Candidatus Berkelbacteria bacterium]|nr:hypothetical protein [Candidatus Berkelbacteria bacterium]